MKVLLSLASVLLFVCVALCATVQLPDYEGPALSMQSGYVTVNETRGRNLFYFLIEAEVDPKNAPLVVWYQGGPGCSGLSGMFSENGPFRASDDGKKVTYVDNGWTKFANMLWVEQPAFVGFSYSNDPEDKKTGDVKAAKDNYAFLSGFLAQHPEYEGRDLWFTGESYGGVYVPMMTNLVLGNHSSPLFSMAKGFAIGNPVFGCQGEADSDIETFNLLYWHGFISYKNKNDWTKNGCNDPSNTGSNKCQEILQTAYSQVGRISQDLRRSEDAESNWPSLNPDDIYYDFCTQNATLEFSLQTAVPGSCDGVSKDITTYLNRPDVQKAFGVHGQVHWSTCTFLDYSRDGGNMNNYYPNFWGNKSDFDILVYSGDVDILTVPFADTQPCVATLDGPEPKIKDEWKPWFVNYHTAGYVEVYDKYTYATVKGAGHEVPKFEPTTAFHLIQRFIESGNLEAPNPQKEVPGYTAPLSQSSLLRKHGLTLDSRIQN